MAFTQGVYEIDAETGTAAVYLVDPADPEDTAPFTDPIANRTRVLFHSDFEYLEIFYSETVTLNLGAYVTGSGDIDHPLPNHGLGAVPFCGLIHNGEQIDGAMVIQKHSTGWRTLELVPDATGFKIVERRFGTTTNNSPAMSITLTVRALRVAPAIDVTSSFLIDPENGIVQFGYGKFSTLGNPKIKLTSGTPAYRMPKFGRSIDSVGGTPGIRFCRPDGTFDDFWGYSGSFANPGAWGVSE